MVKLAHISDPHLPLCEANFSQLLNKRILGFQSWHRNRHKLHDPAILAALVDDIKSEVPDHLAVTGDLTNIALPDEFTSASKWLSDLGPADSVTAIPGNHDAYIPINWDAGPGLWQPNMLGDSASSRAESDDHFPFIRVRKNVALICLSSSVPMPWFVAAGRVSEHQLSKLATALRRLKDQGFFRVVLVHHPPLPGQNSWRKALRNAKELTEILKSAGAELVLHGHNHTHMHEKQKTTTGTAHVFGVPSASARETRHKPAAAWNQYNIRREDDRWHCAVTIRGYLQDTDQFAEIRSFNLTFD